MEFDSITRPFLPPSSSSRYKKHLNHRDVHPYPYFPILFFVQGGMILISIVIIISLISHYPLRGLIPLFLFFFLFGR